MLKPIFRTFSYSQNFLLLTHGIGLAQMTLAKPMSKHKKIRNLVSSTEWYDGRSKWKRYTRTGLYLAVLMCILGVLIVYFDNVIEIHRRLCVHIDRQYNYHVYGKEDYCNQTFQPETLIAPLKVHIINQNDALSQFSSVIENFNGVLSIAFVGGSGVGKTLTCNVLQSNFQWPSNVMYFIWSSVRSKSSQYYKITNSVKENSKKCGAYLVIIDSIDIKYSETIQELNDEIQIEFQGSDISILVVYVFNLASYSDLDLKTMEEKRRKVDDLSGITSIFFRSFDRYDVERCIELESEKLNVSLSDREISEIFEYIDPLRSGCKLIHSKIAMYT